MPTPQAPFAIALPHGLGVSGVATWALRLAAGLAHRARPVRLIVHHREGKSFARPKLAPGVELIEAPALEDAASHEAALRVYRDLARRTFDAAGAPLVLSPNLLGDCYGLGAALCVSEPERVRLVGVQHSDIEYDARVLARYEPVLARFVGVSEQLATGLRQRLPGRAADVAHVPYGVEIPAEPARREPLRGRALRLVYTGRIEHNQKRIRALVHLSGELTRRSIEHELLLIGDGPATEEIDAMVGGSRHVRRLAAVAPEAVAAHLDRADAFVLASRWEGLSVSMLEAMARGCVPIVVGAVSGAREAVDHRVTGVLVDAPFDATDELVAAAMADGVEEFLRNDPATMSRRAWETAKNRFSLDRHVQQWSDLIDSAAAAPARSWPLDRACAFTSSLASSESEGSGAVPPDGAARLRAVLRALAGRRIAIHGAGRHTIELAHVLADSPAEIIAISDDDPGRQGAPLLGWTIAAPTTLAAAGATDVILSSWMHAEAMWRQRDAFERQSLRVHALYPIASESGAKPA